MAKKPSNRRGVRKMFSKWEGASLMTRAVALRVAGLACESILHDPGRSLRDCILEKVEQVPYIIEEHNRDVEVQWNPATDESDREAWADLAVEAFGRVFCAGEDLLEGVDMDGTYFVYLRGLVKIRERRGRVRPDPVPEYAGA
jgi:hypothetical protein